MHIILSGQIWLFTLKKTLKGTSRTEFSQLGLVNDDELSEGAEAGEGANGVADSEFGNFGSNGVDEARKIRTGNEGQRGFLLVLAQYLQVVGEVQACGFDSHSYCSGRIELGNWVILRQNYWAIVVFQRYRWITQFSAQQCLHFLSVVVVLDLPEDYFM